MWSKVTLDVTMEGDLIPVQRTAITPTGEFQFATKDLSFDRGGQGVIWAPSGLPISLLPVERGHCKMDDQKNLDSQIA